jgi:hypothetical protein
MVACPAPIVVLYAIQVLRNGLIPLLPLLASLQDAMTAFGDRKCVVARELTKVFEEILRGSLSEIIGALVGRTIKGEVTVVVEGRRESRNDGDDAIMARFLEFEAETSLSRICQSEARPWCPNLPAKLSGQHRDRRSTF